MHNFAADYPSVPMTIDINRVRDWVKDAAVPISWMQIKLPS